MKRKDIEIMAPVGCMESLHAAIAAGADAIYFGVGVLNMRARSSVNFTLDDLATIVHTAHEAGVKTYLTVNTILYDTEMKDLREVIDRAVKEGVDAIIAADVAAIMYARKVGMEVHISTQCNISNIEAAEFYSQWADVVVLARELSLEQVKYISDQIAERDLRGPKGEPLRIEMFAHGALCMSISGKCYLSEHEEHCSANRGACRQICRRKYLITEMQSGRQLTVDGRYILSPKDLCTIDFLDRFIAAGVRVLKIEGRARGAEYVKRVVESYDEALRAMERGEYTPERAAELKEKVSTVFNRGFWQGYYAGKDIAEHTERYGSSATERKVYVGKVTNFFSKISVAEVLVEAAPINEGEQLMWMGETTGVVEMPAEGLVLKEQVVKHIPQGVYFSIKVPCRLRRGDKLYKMVPAEEVASLLQ
ncbi:MAG: peptidase U32 family protein [Rikenellaceae bacterium]|nr:peptidase U32 family protein [Rikenellaceae bacterium]